MIIKFNGIMPSKKRLIINKGDKYNLLTAIEEVEKKKKNRHFLFLCECGKTTIVDIYKAKSGHTKSCGCLQISGLHKTHNLSKYKGKYTRFYTRWLAIKARCNYEKGINYHNYGGRGIMVSKEWNKDYVKFFKDEYLEYCKAQVLYYKFTPTNTRDIQIDRINVDGNYIKGNCRWVNNLININNKRKYDN